MRRRPSSGTSSRPTTAPTAWSPAAGRCSSRDFAAQVYLDVVLPDSHVARPIRVDSAPPAVRSGDNSFLTDTRWPAALPTPLTTDPMAPG